MNKTWIQIYQEAWSLLKGPLSRWFWPASAVAVVLSLLWFFGIRLFADFVSSSLLGKGEDSAHTLIEFGVWWAMILVKGKVNKHLVLFFMGPVLALVVEACQNYLNGQIVEPFSWHRVAQGMWRGFRASILLVTVEWALVFLLWSEVFILPMLLPFTGLVVWGVSIWVYGASMLDLLWEREGLGARAGFKRNLQLWKVCVGVGLPFAICMNVPLVSHTIGPVLGGLIGAISAVLMTRTPKPHLATT